MLLLFIARAFQRTFFVDIGDKKRNGGQQCAPHRDGEGDVCLDLRFFAKEIGKDVHVGNGSLEARDPIQAGKKVGNTLRNRTVGDRGACGIPRGNMYVQPMSNTIVENTEGR